MYPGSHARSALKIGLAQHIALGKNPFQFGMIGSTDDHTSLATAEEDNFFGKFANSEPLPDRMGGKMAHVLNPNWEFGAAGLAALWAEENTRESLFDAMKRKEVYATSGSRILLRFFAGWGYAKDAVYQPDFVKLAYAGGVPMGGELRDAPANTSPVFLVMALKDPDDANLDRIQIIKGWVDRSGAVQEKVFDVALSDGRTVDTATGKAPAVGSTVDIENASYTNTIGAAQLQAVWTDPAFDATENAFYYARVIEIPKPRWTTVDAKRFGVERPADVPATIQDRAYSSPIWYSPSSSPRTPQ
jgi:hypothetical protein